MVSAGVSKIGKTSIHFVTPGAKINIIAMKFCHSDNIFMQDGALSHTSNAPLAYLDEH